MTFFCNFHFFQLIDHVHQDINAKIQVMHEIKWREIPVTLQLIKNEFSLAQNINVEAAAATVRHSSNMILVLAVQQLSVHHSSLVDRL